MTVTVWTHLHACGAGGQHTDWEGGQHGGVGGQHGEADGQHGGVVGQHGVGEGGQHGELPGYCERAGAVPRWAGAVTRRQGGGLEYH